LLLSTGAIHAQDKPEVEIGGALRFNYNLSLERRTKKRGVIFDMMFFVSMLKPNIKELN
jgi:hypothetical protein